MALTLGGRNCRRLALVAMAAVAIAGLFGAHAEAAPPPGQVSFSSTRGSLRRSGPMSMTTSFAARTGR